MPWSYLPEAEDDAALPLCTEFGRVDERPQRSWRRFNRDLLRRCALVVAGLGGLVLLAPFTGKDWAFGAWGAGSSAASRHAEAHNLRASISAASAAEDLSVELVASEDVAVDPCKPERQTGGCYDESEDVPGYTKRGNGYCTFGFYAGLLPPEAVDLATCAKKCSSERDCKYFSFVLGQTCSRYSSMAGSCDLYAIDVFAAAHQTYAKQAEVEVPEEPSASETKSSSEAKPEVHTQEGETANVSRSATKPSAAEGPSATAPAKGMSAPAEKVEAAPVTAGTKDHASTVRSATGNATQSTAANSTKRAVENFTNDTALNVGHHVEAAPVQAGTKDHASKLRHSAGIVTESTVANSTSRTAENSSRTAESSTNRTVDTTVVKSTTRTAENSTNGSAENSANRTAENSAKRHAEAAPAPAGTKDHASKVRNSSGSVTESTAVNSTSRTAVNSTSRTAVNSTSRTADNSANRAVDATAVNSTNRTAENSTKRTAENSTKRHAEAAPVPAGTKDHASKVRSSAAGATESTTVNSSSRAAENSTHRTVDTTAVNSTNSTAESSTHHPDENSTHRIVDTTAVNSTNRTAESSTHRAAENSTHLTVDAATAVNSTNSTIQSSSASHVAENSAKGHAEAAPVLEGTKDHASTARSSAGNVTESTAANSTDRTSESSTSHTVDVTAASSTKRASENSTNGTVESSTNRTMDVTAASSTNRTDENSTKRTAESSTNRNTTASLTDRTAANSTNGTAENSTNDTDLEVTTTTADPAYLRHPNSLYCWLLCQAYTNEAELVRRSYEKHQGVFGCDGFDVLADYWFNIGDGANARLTTIGSVKSKMAWWGSVANELPFLKAWDKIIEIGRYWEYCWTVKVDPDTAFVSWRLRGHLQDKPADHAVWVRNWDQSFGLLGPIEILSAFAVLEYKKRKDECLGDDKERENGGEDGFIGTCLGKTLKLPSISDFGVLDGTGNMGHCYGQWVAPALHPFKDPNALSQCLAGMMR